MNKLICCVLILTIIAATIPVFSNMGEDYDDYDVYDFYDAYEYPEEHIPLPLEGRVIILDPGHGYESSPEFADYIEHVRMLKLANILRDELEARGATVHLTRETHSNVSIPVRVALINKWALMAIRDERLYQLDSVIEYEHFAELRTDINQLNRSIGILQKIIQSPSRYARVYMNFPFDDTRTRRIHPEWERIFELQDDPLIRYNFMMISLHSNATGTPVNTNIHGADIYMSTNCNVLNENYFANYAHVDIAYFFADMLLDGIDEIGIERRSITPFHFMIIRETNVPAVLVENGFHTNRSDREKLSCNMFLATLAEVYADTLVQYFSKLPLPPIVFEPGQFVYLGRTMALYEKTNIEYESGVVSPQPVRVLDVYDRNWIQIATWLGRKWVDIGHAPVEVLSCLP